MSDRNRRTARECRDTQTNTERQRQRDRPVVVGRHEVEAAVDTVVLDVATVEPRLVGVELTKLTVDVVLDRLPANNQHSLTH